MSHTPPAAVPWLALIALATVPLGARAETAGEAVRVDYAAPAECPDAASFAARVRDRTARARFAEAGELARTFTVKVNADASGYLGSLEFLGDAATIVSRRVHGEQCDAVVSSLALITALSLDASLRDDESATTAAESPPALPPRQARPPALPVQRVRRASPPPLDRSALAGARVGLAGGYGTAIAAPRFDLLAQLDWRSRVSLRLSAHYAWHEVTLDSGRGAKLRQQGLEVSLCPRRFRRAAWVVAPCAAVDFGSLRAAGIPSTELTSVRTETIWWASLGAQLGLSFEPAGPFWVEARVAGEVPLRAGYRFTFDEPRAVAYRVPRFAGSLALAGGVRFW